MYQAPEVTASFDADELIGEAYGTPVGNGSCDYFTIR
jgi:hypothetical protein